MGPLGQIQAVLVMTGSLVFSIFEWLVETQGISPIFSGLLLVSTFLFSGFLFMIAFAIFLIPKEKED